MWAVLALELGLVSLKSAGCASHTRLLATLRLEPACFTGVALRELLVVEKQRRCQLSSRAPRFELDAEALANFRLVLALRASKAGRTEEPCLEGVDCARNARCLGFQASVRGEMPVIHRQYYAPARRLVDKTLEGT